MKLAILFILNVICISSCNEQDLPASSNNSLSIDSHASVKTITYINFDEKGDFEIYKRDSLKSLHVVNLLFHIYDFGSAEVYDFLQKVFSIDSLFVIGIPDSIPTRIFSKTFWRGAKYVYLDIGDKKISFEDSIELPTLKSLHLRNGWDFPFTDKSITKNEKNKILNSRLHIDSMYINEVLDKLGNTSNIEVLCIDGFKLNGIPEEVLSLTHLRKLTLNSTDVTILPCHLAGLSKLDTIIIDEGCLSFTIDSCFRKNGIEVIAPGQCY